MAIADLFALVAAKKFIVMGAFSELSCGIVDSSDGVAVSATQTTVCPRDRTNSRLLFALFERKDSARRDLRNVYSGGRIH